MALIATATLKAGIDIANCYVRIRAVDVVKKDRSDGTFYACGEVVVYKDKATADELGRNGAPSAVPLDTVINGRVKAIGVNIDNNIHQQLYAKLKTDLTAANVTWAEE